MAPSAKDEEQGLVSEGRWVSEFVELLWRLVAIDSVNPYLVPGGAGEGEMAAFVAEWSRAAGLEVTVQEAAPGRPNVIAVARGTGGGRALMLNAHMDTVGVAGMARPHDPYVQGNRLYGRGALDMKGSLAAMMVTAAAAGRAGLRGDVILTAVADEEYASIGTQAIVREWHADAAVVTEPTALDVCVAHKGFVWLDVQTTGVAAHGSRPDLGVDAIVKMGKVLTALYAHDRVLRAGPVHRLLGSGSVHASLIEGGQELSSYPARCRLRIERRTVPGETPAVVEGQMRALLDGIAACDTAFQATLAMGLSRDAYEVDEREPIVELVRRHAAAGGRKPATIGSSGWMDSALLGAAGIPTVIFGPGGEGLHAAVEWVDLDQVARCADVLLAVAREFCA